MARWLQGLIVVGFLVGVQAQPSHAADAKPCLLHPIARLDMHFSKAAIPVISLPLAGQAHPFAIDTGGEFTAVTSEGVARMGLALRTLPNPQIVKGFGGYPIRSSTYAPGFALGQVPLPNYLFMVLPDGRAPDDVDGLLGADLMSRLDADFDFGHMKFNLLAPSECGDGVVYWANAYIALPIQFDDSYIDPKGERLEGHHIHIDGKLDGKNVKLLVDTGATHSTMTLNQARFLMGWLGSPAELQKRPNSDDTYSFPFKSLTLGGITISNPDIDIVDVGGTVDEDEDMLLGMNVLSRFHMYVAYNQKKLYLTPKDGDPAPQAASAPQKSGGQ